MTIPDEILSNCNPEWWMGFVTREPAEETEDNDRHYDNCQHFCRDMYVMVHRNVSTPAFTTAHLYSWMYAF